MFQSWRKPTQQSFLISYFLSPYEGCTVNQKSHRCWVSLVLELSASSLNFSSLFVKWWLYWGVRLLLNIYLILCLNSVFNNNIKNSAEVGTCLMDSHSEAGVLETGLIFGLKQLKIYKKEIIKHRNQMFLWDSGTTVVAREMQLEATMRFHPAPLRMNTLKVIYTKYCRVGGETKSPKLLVGWSPFFRRQLARDWGCGSVDRVLA